MKYIAAVPTVAGNIYLHCNSGYFKFMWHVLNFYCGFVEVNMNDCQWH